MTTMSDQRGLSFCRVGDSCVFLDLAADRYFALSADANEAFLAYLTMGSCAPHAFKALAEAGILTRGDGEQVPACEVQACEARPSRHALPHPSRAPLSQVLRAILQRGRWARMLARQPLAACVSLIQSRRMALPLRAKPHPDDLAVLARLGQAYRQAALLWSEYEQCLGTSLALADDAIRIGEPAHLVFGVQTGPFQAHCWVEAHGLLVSERPDRVERFTPILVA
jgi:hypothetical protein